ncbi:MAG: carbonic anhydrase/acetyltransferase-like protein (isoleucine patch superfamily) [Candidatus Latescibacterota bacterium]|jgi:carbonic anhydrase/acetyltransferase-like protein (isoleucine patch superfamily)
MTILPFNGHTPQIHETAYVAPGAVVIGQVTVEAEVSIWFNAVIRGDREPIVIGRGSNIQDGCVVHTDPGYPCTVAENVTVGHNAILHGCQIASGVTVGMGATVLNGAIVGEDALVAANALVLEAAKIEPRMLVAGVPAKPRRALSDDEVAKFHGNTAGYRQRRLVYMKQE